MCKSSLIVFKGNSKNKAEKLSASVINVMRTHKGSTVAAGVKAGSRAVDVVSEVGANDILIPRLASALSGPRLQQIDG